MRAIYLCSDNICGCDLVENLKIPKNLVSYHIKTLKDRGIIEEVQCGKRKKYRIRDENRRKVEEIFKVLEINLGVK